MTKEQAVEIIKNIYDRQIKDDFRLEIKDDVYTKIDEAFNMAIKALEQQKPLEKFENAKDHIYKLAGDYKCWDNRLSHEESLELCNILKQQSDDCVSRQAVLNTLFYKSDNNCEVVLNKELQDRIKTLPPVTPTHGTCKDCNHLGVMDCGYYCKLNHWGKISKEGNYGGMGDWYCKDFTSKE